MAGAPNNKEVLFYHQVNRSEAIWVVVAGLAVGVLIPLVGWLLEQFILRPLFCQDAGSSACNAVGSSSYYVATVLVTAVAVPVLANWGVFRGLLVAISSAIALWGLQNYVSALANGGWLEYSLFSAALFGAAYLLFYWLMRLRNFGWGLVLALIVILIVRWVLVV